MTLPTITLIAAMDDKRGIGKNRGLLCHLPADLKFFKETTMGKPIFMGHTTYRSIGKPLPGRKNIVFSRSSHHEEGVFFVQSMKEALAAAEEAYEIMVIGGASLYELFLPIADKLIISHIKASFDADTFFPEIDAQYWRQKKLLDIAADEINPYAISIMSYVKNI